MSRSDPTRRIATPAVAASRSPCHEVRGMRAADITHRHSADIAPPRAARVSLRGFGKALSPRGAGARVGTRQVIETDLCSVTDGFHERIPRITTFRDILLAHFEVSARSLPAERSGALFMGAVIVLCEDRFCPSRDPLCKGTVRRARARRRAFALGLSPGAPVCGFMEH
jgi:hypothetical protein